MIFILFVYQVIDAVLMILGYAIILRALLSWLPNLSNNAFVRILHDITDPLIRPFERIQFGGGGFSVGFAPMIAYFVLMIVRSILLPGVFSILLSF